MTRVGELVPRAFLARRAHLVAPELLGLVLVRREPEGTIALRITEVEAYEGAIDPASHGYRGPTPRNATMFGPAGHLYVYWIYGMHHAANIVCGTVGESQAVLIRAGEVIEGQELALARRPTAKHPHELAKGPGRLALSLGFDRSLDGTDVCAPDTPVSIHQGEPCPPDAVRSGPRTGVSQGHETPWRFWVADDRTVSDYRRHVPRKRRKPTG
ncbi:DNA-3-methyladenine glycosylase [Streptacidiphilus sp. PB12-B1b]|uniref:DNA-3-methyladenine glycosylase n=1 Tax=Streptacidiphilus sp. PB12-B1b TaxID=2705012 RepID=UPI0015F7C253|nr:DNA-3-methyladenine glycosylase [Streptacidiphilus sp. PB12-B1b]QMU78490.1 DNA-3-methyladenine glycosylase [Streptacidiphilus sp. PB12-B1b]